LLVPMALATPFSTLKAFSTILFHIDPSAPKHGVCPFREIRYNDGQLARLLRRAARWRHVAKI
jgi:hypothetical protein